LVRPLVCVNGIIIYEGKILLIKRNKEPFKGHWSLVGGKVEEEMPEEAMLREVKEETGLDCSVKKLSGIFYEKVIKEDERHYLLFIYILEAPSKEVTECDEGELRWFDELPDRIAPADKIMIENKDNFSLKQFTTREVDGKFRVIEEKDLKN